MKSLHSIRDAETACRPGARVDISAVSAMTNELVEIRVEGKSRFVPSVLVDDRRVIASGRAVRIAAVMDEELVDGEAVAEPDVFAARLTQTSLNAHILTFAQKVPDVVPRYPYRLEWDSEAVIPITRYADWFERRAAYDVRKAVKRAKRLGVTVDVSDFTDSFVEGISRIYNESPVRQQKAFWHYHKDLEEVRRESATYLERSTFIGAYYADELIGFIKMVRVGSTARTLHVISQKTHSDKKPTNALIAKAVEICERDGVSHLVYGQYAPGTSLTEFKRRNGFEQVRVPRYYIPLTVTGVLALRWNLHHDLSSHVPERVLAPLRRLRARWHGRKPDSVAQAT